MIRLRPPPLYIQAVNRIGQGLENAGFSVPELSARRLMQHAQRRTGLDTWDEPTFQSGLETLIAALNGQAKLSQVGRIAAYWNILDHLCIRLRLIDYRRHHPQVAAQAIQQPLFILGLPRTGTTILYELIAQDPSFRSPASWEVARPLPPPNAASYQHDPRIGSVGRLLAILEKLTPGFRTIHAIGARLPQECVYMLASHFTSEQFAYMYNIPAYREWTLTQDMSAAYAWHAAFLQHLQVDLRREHWVLKAPAHLGCLRYLLGQYPDARIVWTHRQPLEAMASFSSLAYSLRSGFSSNIDPLLTGESEFRHHAKVLKRGMEDRQTLGDAPFIDVGFDAICADPLEVVRTIYARINKPLLPETEQRMRTYLTQRPRHLYGEHQYSAADFGLTRTLEQALYGRYLTRYGAWCQSS